jgi:hypothetical protein
LTPENYSASSIIATKNPIKGLGTEIMPPTTAQTWSPANTSGVVNLPVLLDHPRPAGSTGLVEAELTLAYDPAILSVSAADITLGSIPSQGTGWQLSATVNAATGQISVQMPSHPCGHVVIN